MSNTCVPSYAAENGDGKAGPAPCTAPIPSDGLVYHLLLLRFPKTTPREQIKLIFSAFVGLQSTCLNPEGKPYIHSIRVGANNSPEPFSGGTTHGVVMTFSSTEDRDYYVNDDPVHNEFKKVLAPFVDPPPEGSFRVVDFTDGEL